MPVKWLLDPVPKESLLSAKSKMSTRTPSRSIWRELGERPLIKIRHEEFYLEYSFSYYPDTQTLHLTTGHDPEVNTVPGAVGDPKPCGAIAHS